MVEASAAAREARTAAGAVATAVATAVGEAWARRAGLAARAERGEDDGSRAGAEERPAGPAVEGAAAARARAAMGRAAAGGRAQAIPCPPCRGCT